MIAPVLARLFVRGVEDQLVDGLGHGVAPPSWRRFLSEGKQSRLEASVFCSAGILPAFSESAAGWKPALRNSSVPTPASLPPFRYQPYYRADCPSVLPGIKSYNSREGCIALYSCARPRHDQFACDPV